MDNGPGMRSIEIAKPQVVVWTEIYCGLLALLYLVCAFAGLAFIVFAVTDIIFFFAPD